LQTSCRHGGFWNAGDVGGMQAEAVRVPLADGTLVKLPVAEDSALLPSLLTLSDVLGPGHHAVVRAGVSARTSVTVIGDGAGRVFDRTVSLAETADAYRAMDQREALKVLVRP
jgi:threonine dehydrogenase-like Zn-dependent dehydrogenase